MELHGKQGKRLLDAGVCRCGGNVHLEKEELETGGGLCSLQIMLKSPSWGELLVYYEVAIIPLKENSQLSSPYPKADQ